MSSDGVNESTPRADRYPISSPESSVMSTSSSLSGKRRVVQEPPPAGTHLCNGDYRVPTVDLHTDSGDVKPFVKLLLSNTAIKTQAAIKAKDPSSDSKWLMKPLGISSAAVVPDNNVVKRIYNGIRDTRGARTAKMARMSKDRQAQPTTLDIVVDGYKVTVKDSLKPILMEATADNIQWLSKQLIDDINREDSTRSLPDSCPDSLGADESQGAPSTVADQEEDHATYKQMELAKALTEGLADNVKWVQSWTSFSATHDGVTKTFRVRAKAAERGFDFHLDEIEFQKQRANTFADSGEQTAQRSMKPSGADTSEC